MDERLNDYDVRRTTHRAAYYCIDQISRYLVTTEHELGSFTEAYDKFLEDRNLTRFWKEMERLSSLKINPLERELLVETPFKFSRLEWEVLTDDRMSPNALLFRMMEVAKLQEKEHVYSRLLPMYRRVVNPRTLPSLT